ncbi:MAG: T9SS type A sorting domain-containing protein [Bacteroidales bacterium]|nr:T9SS type A sorting domain-containing protein [Bacteroidales bacterium]
MKKLYVFLLCIFIIKLSNVIAQQQFEFCNNFIQNLSFITGIDEGIEQNLDDNFTWMQNQGYTHLRYFGIYPNGYHIFPSPTLDANGYPTNSGLETYLGIILSKADQYGIIVNFDGLEIIAESNRDTLQSGYGYLTELEVASVVQELLSLGVTFITEEQFGGSYLQAIQTATSQMGATHETTASSWWFDSSYADEQLASVFNFYHYDQAELDSLIALSGTYPPSNIGNLHVIVEGADYYGFPLSVAVGSFGSLEAENWKNVLLFSQIQHQPLRFSIEESNTAFCIWNTNFNFMTDVGNEILSYSGQSFADRPVVNLVCDISTVYSGTFYPVLNASIINIPAIVNTFTLLGYRVIITNNTILQGADFYYLMLVGGANSTEIAPLPDYADSLLNSASTVFLHPTFGIPDENDASDWTSIRNFFGLPSGDTQTLIDALPESVSFNNFNVLWGGVNLWITPLIENLPVSQINTSIASVLLSGEVNMDDIALIIQNGNKYLINSNLIHLETSYIFSELLNGPMNTPGIADIAIVNDMAIIFAEFNTEINIDLPWSGESHLIRYNPQGNKILDTLFVTGGNYTDTLFRGELVLLMDSSTQNINELSLCSYLKNYPNPFNSETNIRFELNEPAIVKLSVYNINGNLVCILFDGYKNKGKHNIRWDGRDFNKNILNNGVYICKLQLISQDKKVKNHNTKIILLK